MTLVASHKGCTIGLAFSRLGIIGGTLGASECLCQWIMQGRLYQYPRIATHYATVLLVPCKRIRRTVLSAEAVRMRWVAYSLDGDDQRDL